MAPIHFKLKHAGLIRRAPFENWPDWSDLSAQVNNFYRLPLENIVVTFTDNDDEEIVICSDAELQDFYRSSYQGGDITFNILDLSLSRGSPEPPPKRLRLEVSETSNRSQGVPLGTNNSPPRLPSQYFEHSMNTALQPFSQYMLNLANGEFDNYFNSIEPGTLATSPDIQLPNRPMLLLHSLGSYPDDPRLSGLFRSDTVHLFGVSGSGKTRLTLEGLCHRWGLYISCGAGSSDRAGGSSDFASAVDSMASMSNWNLSANQNVDAAHRAFAMLLCARVFILKFLLEHLPSNTTVKTARQRWVLVQIMPPFNHTGDIFVAVLHGLRAADKTDLMEFTKKMLKDMTKRLGNEFFPKQGLTAVVDGVQVAAEYQSFRPTTTQTEKRLVLHPFFDFLWWTKLFQGVIFAGTGLSMKMVRTVLSHGLKRQDFRIHPFVFVEVGRFKKDGADHKRYIEQYLRLSQSASDRRLMDRILYWFHGRYRFTAALIGLLLSAPSGSSHRILGAFVHSATGFRLTDAVDLEEEELPITNATLNQIGHYGQIVGSSFFEQVNAVKYIFHAVMLWRVRSQSLSIRIDGDIHQMVAAGVGHLEKAGDNQTFDHAANYPVYLCEPLVVLYLGSILSKRPDTTVEAWVIDAARTAHGNSPRGFVLEEALLLVLFEIFGGKECLLSDAFDTDQPWGSRKVTLVSLKRGRDGQMRSSPVSWSSGSSDRLGYEASSPEDVVKFLNNPDGKCFLFPDHHMGPDLACFAQDVETKELIFLSLQSKLSKKLSIADSLGVLASVNPEFFYDFKVCAEDLSSSNFTLQKDSDRVIYTPSKHPELVGDVMAALLPNIGAADFKPLVEDIREKLCSSAKTDQRSESQFQRSTPRYIRIIASRDSEKRLELFKSDSKGDVAVLRWGCVEQLFGDLMWDSVPCVQ